MTIKFRIILIILAASFISGCGMIRTFYNEERMIERLNPAMRDKVRTVLKNVRWHYPWYKWRVTIDYRTKESQEELYKIGRRGIPGEKILTDTKDSKHAVGMAIDIYPIRNKRVLEYDEAKEAYDYYGKSAKEAGLTWGGDWDDPKDYGHIELK